MSSRNRIYSIITCLLTLALLTAIHAPLPARGWTVRDENGKKVRLSDFRGKWVLVNFWATWCPSCTEEIPSLVELHGKHADLAIIGIAVMQRSRREVDDFAEKHSIPYRILLGDEGTASEFGGIEEMPTSFLYSPAGNLVRKITGPVSPTDIEQIMATAPAESAP